MEKHENTRNQDQKSKSTKREKENRERGGEVDALQRRDEEEQEVSAAQAYILIYELVS